MSDNKLELRKIAKNIKENTLVLPNFQREYVWDDNSRQIGFLASILARIPLGNIIIFNDDKNKFACRRIGKKEVIDANDITEDNVDFLLDGQQRVTTLLLMFSDRLYKDDDGRIVFDRLLNRGLQNRFFIKLPTSLNEEFENPEDIFGYLKLKFPFDDIPKFCSNDIFDGEQSEIIEIKSFNRAGEEWYNPRNNVNPDSSSAVEKACQLGLIPCYWLLDKRPALANMLSEYAHKRCKYLYDAYKDNGGYKIDGKKVLNDVLHLTSEKNLSKYTDDNLKIDLENLAENWAKDMESYLWDCIDKLKINSFEVTEEGTERAIDIYEALNKGGVELSTYDLIIARAAKENTQDSLNEQLESIVKEHCDLKLLKALAPNLAKWSSVDQLDTLKKKSIDKGVVVQFLNLLCITQKCEIGTLRLSVKPSYCREKEQLNLLPRQIIDGSRACMEAIIDALMYLNIKQGVYKLSCIHYKFSLLPIAYAFYVAKKRGLLFGTNSNEENFFFNMLNAWYKTAVFTDFYQTNQSVKVIDHLKDIDDMLCNHMLPDYFRDEDKFKERLGYVLNVQHYNDFKMLTFDDSGYTLSKAIEKYITQYYLSLDGSIDILETNGEKKRMYSYADAKLAIHHFIPLYAEKSLNAKLPKTTGEIRNSQLLINSPLNKVIITQNSNSEIGSLTPVKYKECIPDAFFVRNDFSKYDCLETDAEKIVSTDFLLDIYKKRYENMRLKIQGDIEQSVDVMKNLLNH